MEYPLISEYKDGILSAEDNFNQLPSLRPVLDNHGDPIMSSGNFAVVFKMKDLNDNRVYAVKCFIKDQEGRAESYRKIADELDLISSSYILPLRYLENELFVDSSQCTQDEFPIVIMEWVEGETLDAYLNRNLQDKFELEMLSYRFNRMAAWLLAQPFAHGDLKPDNILVRKDGSLVLVDYDGMFVSSMKGEKARELGSPGYCHPSRNDTDFNEHIDDFSIAVIALSLKAIALNPQLKTNIYDSLLLSEQDYRSPATSSNLASVQKLTVDLELSKLLGVFYIALATNSLDSISFRLFQTPKPVRDITTSKAVVLSYETIDTSCTEKEIEDGVEDEYGVVYSLDGKRLLKCTNNICHRSTYHIKEGTHVICDNAFLGRKSLQNITIPDSVTAIGNRAFAWCFSLQSLYIPNSVNLIGTNPFVYCINLTVILSEESKFKIINNLLIDDTDNLISYLGKSPHIQIPVSVRTIGNEAFYGCESLQSVSIPNSVMSIGKRAFLVCHSLHTLTLPDLLTSIEDEVFLRCWSLQKVTIPNFVTRIGDKAFGWCESLKRINIPKSVTSIGTNPFQNCPVLSIDLSPQSNFNLVNDLLIDSNGKLISCINHSSSVIIPPSVYSIGQEAFSECKSMQSVIIPETVTTIYQEAFSECTSMQSVIIPESVTSIGKAVFSSCSSLRNLHIPNSVTSIESQAFRFCSSLQSINIPKSITAINDETFVGCGSMQSVIIPNTVISIGNKAFFGCGSLLSISIPESVTSIGDEAFSRCGSLLSITIPHSVTSLGNEAFWMCEALQSVSIYAPLEYMGDNVFSACEALHDVTIYGAVSNIGVAAFGDCQTLQKISLPESVTTIGDEAFSGCGSLEMITLPHSVTYIGVAAFSDCYSLQKITIPESVITIGAEAFSGCESLEMITIPHTVTTIGNDAFPCSCKVIRR